MNSKYFFGALLTLPLLPLLYFQGKKIRKSVPRLPEATGNQGRAKPAASRRLRLLVLGESTMAGIGVATHAEGFAGTLGDELAHAFDAGIDWYVYAKSGFTVRETTHHIVPEIKEEGFDLIVIGLGGNDAFQLNTPWGWRRDVAGLIEALREKFGAVPLFFTNMPPIKEFPAFTPAIKFSIGNLVEILGTELAHLAQRTENVHYNARILTFDEWTKKLGVSDRAVFFSDGVHPSRFTYQTWARDFAGFVLGKFRPFKHP